MKRILAYFGITAVFLTLQIPCGYAQDTRRTVENHIYLEEEDGYLDDTLYNKNGEIKDPDKLFNRMKSSESKFVRNIANIILVDGNPRIEVDSTEQEIELAENYFRDYEGLTIDSIIIMRKEIFTPDDSLSTQSKGELLVDKAHIMTWESVIRKYLLFHEGDKLDPLVLSSNEYLLRELSFISSAFIIVRPSDNDGVKIFVFTRDAWTIWATWDTGDFPLVGAYDDNFLGAGNRAIIRYLIPSDKQEYGWQLNYDWRNILGTFIDGEFQVGVGGTKSLMARIERKYHVPGDRYWDVYGGYYDKGERCISYDTVVYPRRLEFDAFYGQSFRLSSDGLFTYFSAGGLSKRFLDPPIRSYLYNPYYHDQIMALGNWGIARQHFFQGNMIYGYGNIEDIPYGFKFELTGGMGYSPQTSNYQYYAALARYAFYADKFGYLDATIKGSIKHMTTNKSWDMGMIDLRFKYFSPLFKMGKGFYMRNFLNFSWTQGINRFIGEQEKLEYTSAESVRGLYAPYWAFGTSRACLRFESVLFTPVYLLHFRLAGFLWGDMAWLGNNSMFWNNQMSAAAGIGFRIKNEKLIINSVEIRLGIGIKTYSDKGYSWFSITDAPRFRSENFNPTTAEVYEFK